MNGSANKVHSTFFGSSPHFGIRGLHVLMLWNFAVAQPVYDLLSANATFFVAHRSQLLDIILLISILSFLLPSLLVALERLAGLLARPACRIFHALVIAVLAGLIFLPPLKRINNLPGPAAIAGASVLGLGIMAGYYRLREIRAFATLLSLTLIVFPVIFLFGSPVRKLAFSGNDRTVTFNQVKAQTPIVMVVFDELSTTALLDEHGQIDSLRYPNFYALSQAAYWFPNATTVGAFTIHALPALLTGRYGIYPRQPTSQDYPKNLFSLLGDSYDLEVFESTTRLCPESLCESNEDFGERFRLLVDDVIIVYLSIITPTDMAGSLPDVSQGWTGFAGSDILPQGALETGGRQAFVRHYRYSDRRLIFHTFLDSLHNTDRPNLFFLHINLPHLPWNYLPSGRTYQPGLVKALMKPDKWTSNEWGIIQAYQQYLLQVGYADTLVGKLVSRLKELELYERCLIVVLADHGVSFRPNDRRRHVTEGNINDLMAVPLFLKVPYQKNAIASERHVQLIDILPTIADILEMDLPWSTDGVSMIQPTFPERRNLRFFGGRGKEFKVKSAATHLSDTLRWKLRIFGSGRWPYALPRTGPHRELVGKKIEEIDVVGKASVLIALDHALLFEDVDPDSGFVPARVIGTILQSEKPVNGRYLAVAVNGKVQAVTKATRWEGDVVKFAAVVPEKAFRKGDNEVEVFLVVTRKEGRAVLRRVGHSRFPAPQLTKINPNKTIRGRKFHTSKRTGFAIMGVHGSNFQFGATVRFDGEPAPKTTYGDDSWLTCPVPSQVYADVETVQVTVENPDGQVSNGLPFAVLPVPEQLAPPRIEKLFPNQTQTGRGFNMKDKTGTSHMAVHGLNFQRGAKIRFNGQPAPRTTYGDDSRLSAQVPAVLYSWPMTVQVTVENPDGQVSNSLSFIVLPAAQQSEESSTNPTERENN